MRLFTTLATIAGLGILGSIVWEAEGPHILETLHLDSMLPVQAEEKMDVNTLVEMCQDDTFKQQLEWKVDAKLERPAFATFGSLDSRAFVGGDASEAEARAAMIAFQQRLDAATDAGPSDTPAPKRHASIRPSQSRTSAARTNINNSQNDYKRIPRMQKQGLTNLQRYGNYNFFGKRSLYNQSRFAQQQRELERLRTRRDNHVNGRVVVKD